MKTAGLRNMFMEKHFQIGSHSGPVEDFVDACLLTPAKTVLIGMEGNTDQCGFFLATAKRFGKGEYLVLESGKIEHRHDCPFKRQGCHFSRVFLPERPSFRESRLADGAGQEQILSKIDDDFFRGFIFCQRGPFPLDGYSRVKDGISPPYKAAGPPG